VEYLESLIIQVYLFMIVTSTVTKHSLVEPSQLNTFVKFIFIILTSIVTKVLLSLFCSSFSYSSDSF
jgi:hypothetical protein